ncbi:dTDP-4-dehydrorhamnose 3,5-epimerase [subsurface metagenome]
MIKNVEVKKIKIWPDDRGYLYETLRSDDSFFKKFGQSNVTLTYPGIIKAFHWHKKQDDIWVVTQGMAQVVLYDLRKNSLTKGQTEVFFMGEQNPIMLFIPHGVAHGYKVLGNKPCMLIYYTTHLYNPKNPDEERIAFDDPKIDFDWETKFR